MSTATGHRRRLTGRPDNHAFMLYHCCVSYKPRDNDSDIYWMYLAA